MNKERRNYLRKSINLIQSLEEASGKDEAVKILNEAKYMVETCSDDEELAYDCLPEQFQSSDRGDDMSDNISDLSDAVGDLEIAICTCEENKSFNYEAIKDEMESAIQSINNAINR